MQRDCYKILEVQSSASDDEIKKKFRSLALKYHPDRNQGIKEAEERFKEVNYAYSILGNPDKRKRYDFYRRLFPPQFIDREYTFAQQRVFEKLFLDQDLGALIHQIQEALQSRIAAWKEFISHLRTSYVGGLGARGPWWSSLPRLPLKVASITGRLIYERLPKRMGKRSGHATRGRSRNDAAHPYGPGDMEMLLPLTKKELEKGTSLKVSLIRDREWVRVNVRVPPGLEPGVRLRLKHKGKMVSGNKARGDLYLKIAVNG